MYFMKFQSLLFQSINTFQNIYINIHTTPPSLPHHDICNSIAMTTTTTIITSSSRIPVDVREALLRRWLGSCDMKGFLTRWFSSMMVFLAPHQGFGPERRQWAGMEEPKQQRKARAGSLSKKSPEIVTKYLKQIFIYC